jgi:nickel transport protein
MLRPPPLDCRLPALVGIAALLLAPAASRAHGIQSNLEILDNLSASRLRLDASFSTGEPVTAATVRLVAPDGSGAIDLGRTDNTGQLTFAVPKQARAGWELQVDGGPGHRDYLELPGAGPQAVHPAAPRSVLARELQQIGRRLPVKGLTGAVAIGALGLGGLGLSLGFGSRSLVRRRR